MIQDFAGDGSRFDMRLSYSYDGPALRGTAGAICNALPLLYENFFVLYGDSYLACNYSKIAQYFFDSGKSGLMTIFRNEGRFDTSNVEAENGSILRYDKRDRTPAMQYIDYGLGVFKRSVFESLPRSGALDLADVYHSLVASGDLASFEVKERFYEIGSTEGIADLEGYLPAPVKSRDVKHG